MTKKEAIARVRKSGNWTEKEAISIVEKEIKRNPDYLEEEGAPEEIFYPTPEYSDESSPINRPFFKPYHEARRDPEELLKEIEEESKFDTSEFDPELHNVDAWFGGEPKEETKEERLERQIDRYNSMRDHVFDSDEGYMQGQDPESRTRQVENQELTQMVEALQRQASEQGDRQNLASIPFGGEYGKGAVLHNTDEFFNRPNPRADAAQGLGQQGLGPQALAQQEALRRIQMQTPSFAQGIGGLPGMTRYPGLGGNKGYTGGSTPFNPYA